MNMFDLDEGSKEKCKKKKKQKTKVTLTKNNENTKVKKLLMLNSCLDKTLSKNVSTLNLST